MTVQMNIAEAKGKLSELVTRAEAGEDVVLARHGKVVAKIVPVAAIPKKSGRRRLGAWEHLNLNIPEDLFMGPDPEVTKAIEEWMEQPLLPPDDDAAA
jgi:prevent-host-death family protein